MYVRPTQGPCGVVGDSSMESGDWRSQLQSGLRQSVVDVIITDTLKKSSPVSGNEELKELKKNAEKFEEKMYTDATSESDYMRKVSLKMWEMGNISQNPMPEASMKLDFTANTVNPYDPASLDSTPQNGNPNGEDWQEEVYQKIKAMKDLYLHDLIDMHQRLLDKLHQNDSLPQQPGNGILEKKQIVKKYVGAFHAILTNPKASSIV